MIGQVWLQLVNNKTSLPVEKHKSGILRPDAILYLYFIFNLQIP